MGNLFTKKETEHSTTNKDANIATNNYCICSPRPSAEYIEIGTLCPTCRLQLMPTYNDRPYPVCTCFPKKGPIGMNCPDCRKSIQLDAGKDGRLKCIE